jgi:hypothetical protein
LGFPREFNRHSRRLAQTLAEDSERLEAMRDSARETLRRFSLEALDANLRAVEKKLRPGGEGDLEKAGPF